MRKVLLALAAAVLALPAAALTQTTAQFLTEIGISPDSADVQLVARDVVRSKSLDTLAARRDEDGVRRFIATRAFIHRFRQDSSTPYPDGDLYQISYLTAAEKAYITQKIQESWGVKV